MKMKCVEEYKGTYEETSRESIRETLKRGRANESYVEFVLSACNVKVVVDDDGITFDVFDITNPVFVLIGNKMVIENEELLLDLLIDYSSDRLSRFKQHREKVAKFVIDYLTSEQKDALLISFLLSELDNRKVNKDVDSLGK